MYNFRTEIEYSGDRNKKAIPDVTRQCLENRDYHIECELTGKKSGIVLVERELSRYDANQIENIVKDGVEEGKSYYEIWEEIDDKYSQEQLTLFVGENNEELEIAVVKEDNVELEYVSLFIGLK